MTFREVLPQQRPARIRFKEESMLKVTIRGLVSAAIAVCLAAATASAQPNVTRFKSNGDFGDAYFGSGSIACSVYVASGGSAQNTQTYLQYYCYNGSTPLAVGWGFIPNKSLQGSPNRLILEVDTSTVAGFTHDAGSGGSISLQWLPDGVSQYRTSGTQHSTWRTLGMARHQSGTWSQASANVSGSLLGIDPTQVFQASVGQNNSVTIEFEKNP